ncbi:hypothetical protein ACFLS1_08605 [Verrucomicrobiota bacterium]
MNILFAMFCLGLFSTITQVMFMREMLVVFAGNELSIAVILTSWLVGVGFGAFSARIINRFINSALRIRRLLVALLLILSVLLPFQVYVVRIIRLLLKIPAGEFASLGSILVCSLIVFLPSCYSIGLFFPFACKLISESRKDVSSVSKIYTFEAIGSMAGGAILTYMLLPVLSPLRIILLASMTAVCGAAAIIRAGKFRLIFFGSALLMLSCVVIYPAWFESVENRVIAERWRAFGVLQKGKEEEPAVKLICSENTIYQNLAVTESYGQYTLYGNGRVMFNLFDPFIYEPSVHFIMAQKPDAQKILLLGGNPVGDLPELLKYPLERLVYVDLDPGIGRMVGKIMPEQYDAVLSDPRVQYVVRDAPRFVRACGEKFDVIIVNAPEPVTAAVNRYYTLEFFISIKRMLAEGGFMYAAVSSSERLRSEALHLGASVHKTLKEVFPVVLVTAGSNSRFFAGEDVTLDGATLMARSQSAGIKTRYFRPEYFMGVDDIWPEKIKYVEDKFSSADVSLNTTLRPVTFFYNLMLWSRFSGSGVEGFLGRMKNLNYRDIVKWIIAGGLICLLIGVFLRGGKSSLSGTSRTSNIEHRTSNRWARVMIGVLIATTGFCGMALEIVLIYVFQGLYGYVYTRMGLIVAVFMLGLSLGALSGRLMARKRPWLAIGCVELLLIMFSLMLPLFVKQAAGSIGINNCFMFHEAIIFLAVGFVGWAVGAEFPLCNRLFCDAGGSIDAAAAITDSSDHFGAAIGALAVGVVLVPVLGIGASCMVLAALKVAGLFMLVSGFIARS